MKKTFILFLLICLNQVYFAQNKDNKYHEVDSLINVGTTYTGFKAMSLLEGNLSKYNNEAEYWCKLSLASYYSRLDSKAKRCLNKAIKINPNYNNLYLIKSRFLFYDNKTKDAINLIDSIINIKQKGEYYFYRGIYNYFLSNKNKAKLDYYTAKNMNFISSELFLNISVINAEEFEFTDAIKNINLAIKLNPNNGRLYFVRGKYKLLIFNIDDACKNFKIAKQKEYHSKSMTLIVNDICNTDHSKEKKFYNLAEMYFHDNKKTSIYIISHLINDLKIEKSKYYTFRGYAHSLLENHNKAEKDYLKAITLPSDSIRLIYRLLVNDYLFSDKYKKALKFNDKLLEIDKNDYLAYADEGRIYSQMKKYKKALESFNKSIALNNKSFNAYAGRANIFLKQGKLQNAFDDSQFATVLNSNYAFGYYILGKTKYAMKKNNYCSDLIRARELGQSDLDLFLNEYCNTK